MDQDLGWWAHVVFARWRDRPGARYQRLAAALLDAVEAGMVSPGSRLPAERLLADALGVSRGTVVAAVDQVARAGVVRRRQGSGTFIAARPSWTRAPTSDPVASLLLRRLAARGSIDLSLSVPPGTDHLPAVDWRPGSDAMSGHGLDPVGSAELRGLIAEHLSERQQLPTTADQLVLTAGAQQALSLVAAVVGPRAALVAGCPMYPGVRSAFGGRGAKVVPVAGDGAAGADVDALARSARKTDNPVIYVTPTGSNPTGSVMPLRRREALIEGTRASGALVVEDLALADLTYTSDVPPPVAAMDPTVVAVGSLSKLLWAGLRIGWIRADEPLRSAVLRAKAATDLAVSQPAQTAAAPLMAAVDRAWMDGLLGALAFRRDHLGASLSNALPSWTVNRPDAGLSLWVKLPLGDADAFVHTAAGHGVVVASGSVACACGRHRGHIRLSFAHPPEELDLAVERLVSAWEIHCADLAATPVA